MTSKVLLLLETELCKAERWLQLEMEELAKWNDAAERAKRTIGSWERHIAELKTAMTTLQKKG